MIQHSIQPLVVFGDLKYIAASHALETTVHLLTAAKGQPLKDGEKMRTGLSRSVERLFRVQEASFSD